MKPLLTLLLFLAFVAVTRACPDCGTSHLVLLGKPSTPEESIAWKKLQADLATRFNVFPIDFDGDDSAGIAELPAAKLLVIGSTPETWPADLSAGVQTYLDRGFPLLVLDDHFKNKTTTGDSTGLFVKLDLALGCDDTLPAPEAIFARKFPALAEHTVMTGVPEKTLAALTPAARPCHLLATLARDSTETPVAWMTAYQAAAPVDRLGNVAVVPLSSTAALTSPDVRRLVVQASLAATDNEDLIPAAGMIVTP